MQRRKNGQLLHGMSNLPEYAIWRGMWQRCTNPNREKFAKYKDRAPPPIWKDFTVFLADVGRRPSPLHTLERLNNNQPYGPGNTAWATPAEQSRNTGNNKFYFYKGRQMLLADIAREIGVPFGRLRHRLQVAGWSMERATTQPLDPRKANRC